MKKLLVPFAALFLFSVANITAVAQGQDTKNLDRATGGKVSKKSFRISGTVGNDGQVLISDKDNKTWKVANPSALKDNEGRHVTVKAHVNADKEEIYILSVKLAPVQSQSARLGDAAFRR
jgi:hypothetical protein